MQKNGAHGSCIPVILKGREKEKENIKPKLYSVQELMQRLGGLKVGFKRDFEFGACAIRRSAYILEQDSLPPSCKSFLNKHGGKAAVILRGVKELACGVPCTELEMVEKHYKTMGVNIKLDPQMKVPCTVTESLAKPLLLDLHQRNAHRTKDKYISRTNI